MLQPLRPQFSSSQSLIGLYATTGLDHDPHREQALRLVNEGLRLTRALRGRVDKAGIDHLDIGNVPEARH
jgi:hypothetical protein